MLTLRALWTPKRRFRHAWAPKTGGRKSKWRIYSHIFYRVGWLLNISQKVFPVNAAISKWKLLHGLNQVTQAQGILIPVKWEQSTNFFLSQTWEDLYFPASPLGLPDGMCQNLNVDFLFFFSFRPGKHESLSLQFVKILFPDSSWQPCTQSSEKWAHLSPEIWLREHPRRTCAHSSLWEGKQQKEFGRKWGQTSSRISKTCGITQEPQDFLPLHSRDDFQKGKANLFPQFSME